MNNYSNSFSIDQAVALDENIRRFLDRLPRRFATHELGMFLHRDWAVKTLKNTASVLRGLVNYRSRKAKLTEILLPTIKAVHRLWNCFASTISCYADDLLEFLNALEGLLPADTVIQYDLFEPQEIETPHARRLTFPGFKRWAEHQNAVERLRAGKKHFGFYTAYLTDKTLIDRPRQLSLRLKRL
ncbi:hypothetical protein [Myxosarcina sp. GI1(2024)]